MSVQQAAIHGAKSHLGPYAVCRISGAESHDVQQQHSIKKQHQSFQLQTLGAASSSSKAPESELSLWESRINRMQNLTTETGFSLFNLPPFSTNKYGLEVGLSSRYDFHFFSLQEFF